MHDEPRGALLDPSVGVSGALPRTVWLEVEDFLQYFDDGAKPVGISRVQMELFTELRRLTGSGVDIRFCRLDRFSHRFKAVTYAELQRTFRDPPLTYAPWLWPAASIKCLLALPKRWLSDGMKVIGRIFRAMVATMDRPGRAPHGSVAFHPGDVLVCTGMSWVNSRYGKLVAAAKRRWGIGFLMLFHDIIPISHPEFSGIVRRFRRWTDEMLRNADGLATQSRYSRDALLDHARKIGFGTPPVTILRLGALFARSASEPLASPYRFSLPRPYVLFVSTIEIRKNHMLLVRVWKRLIARHGEAAVPALVFVGARGWLVKQLWAELAATRYLDGKVRIMSGLSDAELELCYRYCLLTAYPSFVEGWGLPVAESLLYGKLCIASNRSSLPEVGGPLADYFDPDDEESALAVFERAIFDRAYRESREAQIRRDYQAPSWVRCAETLLHAALEASRSIAPGKDTETAPVNRIPPIVAAGAAQ